MADQLFVEKTQCYESSARAALAAEQAQIRLYEAAWLEERGGRIGWGIVLALPVAVGLGVNSVRRRRWETLFLGLWLAFRPQFFWRRIRSLGSDITSR